MVEFPQFVKVGGHRVVVEVHHGKLGDAAGEWLPWKHILRIDTQQNVDEDVGDEALFHTFLNEILHTIDGTYCDYRVFQGPKHGEESEWMNPFCEGLMQVILDNWEMLEKIKKVLDKVE